MVFSGTEAASGGEGHGGDVTGTDTMMFGSVTCEGSEGDDTEGTRDDAEMGTGEKDEGVTSRGPNRELIGHEDMALTGPGGELTRVKGSIPSDLRGVTPT